MIFFRTHTGMYIDVEGEAVQFPADLGAQCAAWDDGYHPRCENGETGPWCGESWCYVDPCNCDLPASPTRSEYLPDGEHQGKPVHFSYATCDSVDTWTKGHAVSMRVDLAEVCSKRQDEEVWGKRGCRCVGISERPGATEVEFGQDLVAYPAGLGAKCEDAEGSFVAALTNETLDSCERLLERFNCSADLSLACDGDCTKAPEWKAPQGTKVSDLCNRKCPETCPGSDAALAKEKALPK